MAAGKRIIEEYANGDIQKKIRIILKNYPTFGNMVECLEISLSRRVIEDRKVERNKHRSGIGVRVQDSNISDPTVKQALERETLSRAIEKGVLSGVLREEGEPEEYVREAEVLEMMRNDYSFVRKVLEMKQSKKVALLISVLEKTKSYDDIANEYSISVEAARVKIIRIRTSVIKELECIF